jgi:serine/threonine protein kinase
MIFLSWRSMIDQTMIGRYRVQEYLGNGTYAVVYRAEDTLLKRPVALKVLKPIWARDREISARFLREAQAAANLIHPHIAWVYDMGEAEGRNYLAARYLKCESLDKILAARGALPWEAAVRIVEDIGEGLDYAHSRSIIHRDVKPQNILISASEGAVLTDFGLTRALEDTARLTAAGSIVGTPQYIPPEVWNGEPAGPAADQYALGCIFFEALTGATLFEGQVIDTIIRGHMDPARLLGRKVGGLPPGTFEVLRQALAPRPIDRFDTTGDFAAALQALDGSRQASGGLPPVSLPAANSPEFLPPDPPPFNAAPQPDTVPDSRSGRKPGTAELAAAPADDLLERDTQRIGQSGSGKTASLDSGTEWRNRLERVYRRVSSLGSGRLRGPASYRLLFRLSSRGAPGENGETLQIDRDQIVIGRAGTNDVVVDYPDVSRQHASILKTDDGYLLKDLRSTNGTYLNDERVLAEVLLHEGDEIRLGSTVRFVFEADD